MKKITLYDNIKSEVLLTQKEVIEDMIRKEILSKYKIKQLPNNGRYYVKINGKTYKKTYQKDLEELIINLIKNEQNTINSIFFDFLDSRKADYNIAQTTWQKDIRLYNMYIKDCYISQKPLEDITLDDWRNFFNYCKKIRPTIKKKYWDCIKATINAFYEYAIDEHLVSKNIFKEFKPNKSKFAPATHTDDANAQFTDIESNQICSLASKDAQDKRNAIPLGLLLLFNLGLRIGELCALKWGDIINVNGTPCIHIQRELIEKINEDGKSIGKQIADHCKTPAGNRKLPLNQQCLSTLRLIKELNEYNGFPVGNDDFIFLRKYKGQITYCTDRCFAGRLEKYCKQNNMPVCKSPHDIRRTVITRLYYNGINPKDIQYFAGHSEFSQTMDYIKKATDNSLLNVDCLIRNVE